MLAELGSAATGINRPSRILKFKKEMLPDTSYVEAAALNRSKPAKQQSTANSSHFRVHDVLPLI